MDTSLRFILFAVLLVKTQCISLDGIDKATIDRLAEYIASEDCDDPAASTTEAQCGVTSNCEAYSSKEVPNSVHELRAGDIKIVAAIGDGMTVGNAAGSESIRDTLTEYRGFSFSAGGQGSLETIATLPNILKKFNPSLKGFSTSSSIGFNVAETGATTDEVACQAAELIDMMKADTSINYEKDWKVVTILIGGNDFCDYCLDREQTTSNELMTSMYEALDLLLDEMPRAFINIVSTWNAHDLSAIADQGPVCSTVYMKTCPCVAAGGELVEQIHQAALKYQELLDNLIATGRYEKQDFTVVVQPFLQQQTVDKTIDASLVSVDCINLSKKGQAVYGLALWQSMFLNTNEKATDLQSVLDLSSGYSLEGHELFCPTQNQFLATSTNSASGFMSADAVSIDAVDDSSSSSNGAIIAVSVIGGCLCLVAVAFGVVGYRRVKQRNGYSTPEGHPMVTSSGGYTKLT